MPPPKYYVVEFWASPRPGVDRCVCVPDTWLTWIDESSSIASVAYPGGNPADIEELARNNRSNPNDWLAYNAHVKFSTSSYEQAMKCLCALRKIKSSGTISIIPNKERRFSEGPSRPGPTTAATTPNSGGNCVKKAYKRPLLVNVSTRVPMHQIKTQQVMLASAGTAKHSSVSGTQYSVHDDHPNRSVRASLESRPMGVSQSKNPSTSIRDVQAQQNVSHGSPRHACCATKFEAVLGSVQLNFQKLVTEFNYWATVNAKNNKKLIEVGASWAKDYQVWKRSVQSQLSERPPMSEMPRKIKAEIILIEDDDDVNHGNSTIPNQVITTQEPRRVQQRRIAQFTLPPEYDRNDSRWTLRYRYPGPTLTELTPHSRIYADAIKLAYSLVSATDCRSLARLLVMEVFSDNALKVCSFTGARSPIYSRNSPVRPGLDENARNTLVKYVEKCGRQKGWRIPDVKTINQTMRGKLEDCKRKAKNKFISVNN